VKKKSPLKAPSEFEIDPTVSLDLAGKRQSARLSRGHLEAIVWVSQAGSIHSAAQRFKEHQPLISKRLAEAEEVLGMELFVRSRSGCLPRPEAKNLIGRSARILRELQALEVREDSSLRSVRLGCIPRVMHTLFPSFIQKAANATPSMRLNAIELHSGEVLEDLLRGKLDAVIGQLTDFTNFEGLVSRHLYDEVTVFVVDAGNTSITSPIDLESLIQHPFILPAYSTSTRRSFERLLLNERLESPVPVIETKSFESSLALLAGSPFVTLIPEPVALRHEALGQIRRVQASRRFEPVGICLFYRFDQTLDPLMQQLEQLVREHIGESIERVSGKGVAVGTHQQKIKRLKRVS
jgi:LysR family pca operon transcriptional activator